MVSSSEGLLKIEGSTGDVVAEAEVQDLHQIWQRLGIQTAYKSGYGIKPVARTQRSGQLQPLGADDAAISI